MSFEWLEPYHPWFALGHVLAAIVALGGNVGYVFWLSHAERDRAHLGFTVAGIRRLDERVTGPAYALLLVTGIVMILAERWSVFEPWLLAGIVLYFVSGGVSVLGLTPALRAQLSAAELDAAGPGYERAARRSRQMAWLVVTSLPSWCGSWSSSRRYDDGGHRGTAPDVGAFQAAQHSFSPELAAAAERAGMIPPVMIYIKT